MASEVLEKRIKDHEGFIAKPYLDSLGKATIGYGHLITDEDNFENGKEYSQSQLLELFRKDLARAEREADDLTGHIEELHIVARDCIIEMCFQLGKGGVKKFAKMLLALEERNYKKASLEMLDSRCNQQTPARCQYLSKLMGNCR